jgi:endonuclease YncB( thermonuclease family)
LQPRISQPLPRSDDKDSMQSIVSVMQCPWRRAMLLGCCAFVIAISAVGAEPIAYRVVSVHDGDTLTVLDASNVQHKVRLHGIDAPERRQPFGTKARERLAELTHGKSVRVLPVDRDRYGRTVARIEVEGQDVNRQMIADGLAWHYTRYSKDAAMAGAERDARAARRGLWADAAPVPPWEWRAEEKERKRKPVTR